MKVLINNKLIDFSLVYSIEDNESSISLYFINTETPITFTIKTIYIDSLFDESMLVEIMVDYNYRPIEESIPEGIKENRSDYNFWRISGKNYLIKKTDLDIVNKRLEEVKDEEQKKFEKFKGIIKKEYLNSDKIDLLKIQY